MVLNPLTPSKGHQFDPRVKIFHCILVFSSSPLIWYATWPCLENSTFDPSSSPKSQTLGHAWPRGPYENSVYKFYIFHLWEDTQSLVKKSLKLTLNLGKKVFLTPPPPPPPPPEFGEKSFFDPQPPTVPLSPTPGSWPRRCNENHVWYVLYHSFVRRHTKFGLQIFEIDFVIEILWYLTFWPLSRAPGGGDLKNCAIACAIDISKSHTKSGWISEFFFLISQPPMVPASPTLGAWPRRRSDMFYIFHFWDDTQSLA